MLFAILRSSGSSVSRTPGATPIKTLAVQPFSNLTGDTAQIYLAKGLTDQLVTTLAQLSALRVINLKETNEVTGQLVKELSLDAVLAAARARAQSEVADRSYRLWAVPDGDESY